MDSGDCLWSSLVKGNVGERTLLGPVGAGDFVEQDERV